MKYTALQAARLLVAHGIMDVIISPGSRNAPLVQALCSVAEKDALAVRTVIDERSAAFAALGMAIATRRPVVLVCTSGTALLNYAPAVAEAFYQGVPLLLLTADRPMQWIDQDDSQTIHQPEALSRIVKGNFNLPDSTDQEMDWYANRIINEAILLSKDGKPGPVHINMQFAEPLTDGTVPGVEPLRVIREVSCETLPSRADMVALAERLLTARVLVVAGFMPPSAPMRRAVEAFTNLPNVALLAEKTSNLHLPAVSPGIDTVLATGQFPLPDIVITLGGALVSRHIKGRLRVNTDVEHWSLDSNPYLADCFCRLAMRIKADPALFLMRLTHLLRKRGVSGSYHAEVEACKRRARQRQQEILARTPWSDLKAHALLYSQLPRSATVFCSNGTAVRYAELLASPAMRGIFCNRGTSGIEGCTSTAAGSALATEKPTLLISGDMCLRHDIAGLKIAPDNLRIVVFNNGGGDIFRFISSTRQLAEREQFFACPEMMTPSVEALAGAFGFEYSHAETPATLETGVRRLLTAKDKGILEVDTSCCPNAEILTDYFEKLKING